MTYPKPPDQPKHATVVRDGFTVPIIGIPQDSVLEMCDLCGIHFGLGDIAWNGKQMLCKKCAT